MTMIAGIAVAGLFSQSVPCQFGMVPYDDRQNVAGTDFVRRGSGNHEVVQRLVGALLALLLFGGDQPLGDQLGWRCVRRWPGLVRRIGHFDAAAGCGAAAQRNCQKQRGADDPLGCCGIFHVSTHPYCLPGAAVLVPPASYLSEPE